MLVAIAHAMPYAPQIDFRDGSFWSDANEEHSYSGSQSGVDLTISAAPGEATLWWDDKDGLGIRFSYENDEVESEEILRISFHDEIALLAIYISDLFVEDGYAEKGSYRINDGAWVHFDAMSIPGSNDNGERLIAFGPPIHAVDSIEFSAPGKINHNENHEFALMAFDRAEAREAPSSPAMSMTALRARPSLARSARLPKESLVPSIACCSSSSSLS